MVEQYTFSRTILLQLRIVFYQVTSISNCNAITSLLATLSTNILDMSVENSALIGSGVLMGDYNNALLQGCVLSSKVVEHVKLSTL